jgi:hypothetical protein
MGLGGGVENGVYVDLQTFRVASVFAGRKIRAIRERANELRANVLELV